MKVACFEKSLLSRQILIKQFIHMYLLKIMDLIHTINI